MATADHSPTPEELMAYLDDETTPDVAARVRAHLATCERCTRLAEDLRGISRATSAWTVGAAPVTLRLPASSAARPIQTQLWRRRSWQVSVAAAGGLVLIVAAYVPRRTISLDANGTLTDGIAATDRPLAQPSARAAGDRASAMHKAMDKFEPGAQTSRGRGGFAGGGGGGRPTEPPPPGQAAAGPRMRVRTATLRVITRQFEAARPAIERLVADTGGFIDQMTATGTPGTARALTGTLRVPAARLSEALTRLRQLGQVVEDTQGSDDVTDQIVDLDARLANARATEQRLSEILKNRTGRLSDVLDVERELARVRLEIERMDAERLNVGRRVNYAIITVDITEERKAGLESGPLSVTTRLRIAAADGLESALESIIGAVLFVLRAGPALILWVAAAAFAWSFVRRIRRVRSDA